MLWGMRRLWGRRNCRIACACMYLQSAMLQSLVTSLSDITRRWAADQGDRSVNTRSSLDTRFHWIIHDCFPFIARSDSVHDKYVEGIGAMAQDLENRAARTRTALTDVARLAEADRASSQRLNDVVVCDSPCAHLCCLSRCVDHATKPVADSTVGDRGEACQRFRRCIVVWRELLE